MTKVTAVEPIGHGTDHLLKGVAKTAWQWRMANRRRHHSDPHRTVDAVLATHLLPCYPQMRIEEMSEVNKAELIAELEVMAWNRLFNCHPWLADRETIWALHQKLIKMGLVEHISSDTWRSTPLGTELDVDLFEVFMGLLMNGRCHPSSKITASSMSGT